MLLFIVHLDIFNKSHKLLFSL